MSHPQQASFGTTNKKVLSIDKKGVSLKPMKHTEEIFSRISEIENLKILLDKIPLTKQLKISLNLKIVIATPNFGTKQMPIIMTLKKIKSLACNCEIHYRSMSIPASNVRLNTEIIFQKLSFLHKKLH